MKPKDECVKCNLTYCGYVPWYKPKIIQYPVMFVGQAPGHVETITKAPFTGPAGKVLWRLMHTAGLDKDKCFITNICECAPPDDRAPSNAEMELCKEHLIAEISEAKPELIVALGEVAASALTGRTGIQSLRGQIYPLLSKWDYSCPVLCMLHPSFIMRQRQWMDIAVKDMEKIIHFFNKTLNIEVKVEPKFVYDPPDSDFASYLAEMSKGITAVDIETPAELDILTARIIGIAFCSSVNFAVALNLTERDKGTEKWNIMKRFLEDPNAKKCTQNGQFDLGVLESHGIVVKGLAYDTLLAEHTMNSDLPGKLDSLRGRYTSIPAYKPSAKEMKTIARWTNEQRASMNCWDVITTWAVMEGQKKVMNQHQLDVLTNIELPMIEVCNYMERRGIKVNTTSLALMYKEVEPKANELNAKYFAPLSLNPRSPVQIKKYLKIQGTDEDTLTALIKRNHPQAELMEALLEYRRLNKIASVYLLGVYQRLRNDRIHAHPKIEGTGTGRLSYQNPNLQNVPEPMRVIYIPDSEDYVLLNGDYNQLELRVGANIAPEPMMLKEFAEGRSVHQMMGEVIFKKPWDELTAAQKLQTKTVVFGTFYGRTPRSIAIEFGISVANAEVWQNLCIKHYPGLLAYVKRQAAEFNNSRRCNTPFGRVRVLQTITQAYNTPIQSSASDVTLTTLIELKKRGFDLCTTVHDSIVIQAPKKDMMDVSREMKRIMERPIPQLNNYQFPIKLKAGDDWYNIKEVVL